MNQQNKKILYITNVNLDGKFLPGVVSKIKGQLKAMGSNHYETYILYTGDKRELVFQKDNKRIKTYKGARQVNPESGFFSKLMDHLRVSWLGSINFSDCYSDLVKERFDAIYLRFYLPGSGLIKFLQRVKKDCPSTLLLLEYPTLNVLTEMKKRDMVSRVNYYLNRNKIAKLNSSVDHIVTLTKDKRLFGKPAIHMPNGIALEGINPVGVPPFSNKMILIGVTSDCAFYHGFDKVIEGMAEYKKTGGQTEIFFRIISNPLSTHVTQLKDLARELNVQDHVSFEMPKTREELAFEYSKAHLGIGTLALHRIGLMDNYSLKHREYAAFGLPFIMSKGDDHFEASPFVLTVERNDEPLDIQQVIDFYVTLTGNHPGYPQEFRSSVEDKITWMAQMKNVFEAINKARTG